MKKKQIFKKVISEYVVYVLYVPNNNYLYDILLLFNIYYQMTIEIQIRKFNKNINKIINVFLFLMFTVLNFNFLYYNNIIIMLMNYG